MLCLASGKELQSAEHKGRMTLQRLECLDSICHSRCVRERTHVFLAKASKQ